MSKKVSRRKFLTYMLGGTAGFLGAGLLFPMVRFAVDPVLKKGGKVEFVDVNLPVSEITETPRAVEFKIFRKDGWYQSEDGETMTAWVMKDPRQELGIVAFSPICKHLGCTVDWESNPQFKNEFFCPCHFGRYTKDGINVPGTPPTAPLDKYELQVKDGRLLIGPIAQA